MPLAGSGHPDGPYFTVDLHLHTTRGSSDSNISPQALVIRAREIQIGAVCVTEHDNMWESREIDDLAAGAGVIVLHGMEVTTDCGHIGVFGRSTATSAGFISSKSCAGWRTPRAAS